MKSDNGRLEIEVRLLEKKMREDAERIKRELEAINQKVRTEGNSTQRVLDNMLKGAVAFFTTQQAMQFAKTIAIVRGEFQQLEVAYSTMLGNKAKADKLMADTIDFASKTPFDLQGVAGGVKQLLAYGSEAENVTKELTMLGNIASGLSMPLGDLIYLYGTTRTEGRMFMMDYRQFMGRGIPLADELAKHFKVSKNEVAGLVTAGKVGFPEVQKALQNMTSEGGRFYNLMEEQSKTITGKMSNLGDAISQMYNEIGKSQEGTINAVLDGAGYVVEHYKEIGRVIADLVVIYGSYKAAVITLNAIMVKRRAILVMINQMAKVEMSLNKAITKAEAVRIVQTRLLTKALIKQRVAQIKANLAAMANPYVLAGAAVAGLTYFIYKLITAQSLQEKAQERLNERIKEQKEQAEAARQELEKLIDIIKDEVSTRVEKQRAFDTLQRTFPNIFSNMDIEAIKTANLTELLKKQNEEREKRDRLDDEAKIKENEAKIEKEKSSPEAYSHLDGSYIGTDLQRILELENENLRKKIAKYDREKAKADFEALSPAEKIKQTKEENRLLQQQYKIADKKAKLEEKTTGISIARYNAEAIQKQILLNNQKMKGWQEEAKEIVSITSLTAELTKKKAELKKLQSVTTWGSREERSEHQKQIETLKGEIDELEKTRKTLTGKDTKKENKSKSEVKDYTEQIKRNAEEKQQLAKELAFQLAQTEIDGKKEGLEKQLAQNELNYKKEVEQIERQRKDLLAKINKWEREEWEAKHPKYKEQGLKYVERILLPEKEDAKLSQMEVNASVRFDTSNEKIYTDELNRQADFVRTYLQKAEDFENRKKQLKKEGYSDELIAKLTEIEEEQLARLNEEMAIREESLGIVIDSLVGMGINEVLAKLKEAEQVLATELQKGGTDKQQIKALQSKLNTYKIALEQKATTSTKPPDNAKWRETVDIMLKIDNATQKAINGFEGMSEEVKNVLGTLSTISSASISVISTISDVATNAGTSMKLSAIMASESIKTVEKASVILAIISAAMQVAQKIMSIITGNRKKNKQALEKIRKAEIAEQREYNELLWEQKMLMEDAESIFGVDALSKALGYLEAYNQAFAQLQEKLRKKPTRESYFGGLINTTSLKNELDKIEVVTGHRRRRLFRRAKTYYTSITKLHKDLITEEGELNILKAESILKTREMRDEDKMRLEEIIQLYKQQKEAQKSFNDYLKETFGELGEGMMDSVINSLKTGEDAFESFAKNVGNVMGKLGKQIMYELFISSKFKQLQKDITKIYDSGREKGLSKDTIIKQVRGAVASFADNVKGDISLMQEFAKTWQKESKELGFDVWGAEKEKAKREAVQKGFATMTQDQASSLDGKFTLFTKLQRKVLEMAKEIGVSMKMLQENSAKQLKHLAGIETNTATLHQMKTDIGAMKSGIEDINDNGIKVRR